MADPDFLPTNDGHLPPVLAAASAPIPGDAEAGRDVTYDDDFQQMKAEIDALASATGGGVNFEKVARLGENILATKAKDLRVAAFLTMALERTRGLTGFAEGVTAVDLLLKHYWDDMFPPLRRMAARQNALQAMSDRVKDWLAERQPVPDDRASLEETLERLRSIQAFTMEQMEERAPALSGLVQSVEALLRKIPEPKIAPEAAEPPAKSATNGQPAQAASPPVDGGSVSVADVERTLLQLSDAIAAHDATSELVFRIPRIALWSAIREEPPAEGGRTLIPPPDDQVTVRLRGVLEKRQFDAALEIAEGAFREYPLWIGLQRFVSTSLEGLGADFKQAREGVIAETTWFVRRLPGIVRLSFSDGTPLADGATRAWLETTNAADESGGNESEASKADPLEAQFREARDRLVNGSLEAAIQIMRRPAPDGSGERAFLRRLLLARLCLDGDRPSLARPVLDELSEEAQDHGLDRWQPSLALDLWTALHTCYSRMAADDQGEDRLEMRRAATRAFDRICRLDPARALTLGSGT